MSTLAFFDETIPDFFTVIPNLTLTSTILKWCHSSSTLLPQLPHQSLIENLVRTLIFSSSFCKNSTNELVGNFFNHLFAVEFDIVQDLEFREINDSHVRKEREEEGGRCR
ncbi:hypothetical protein HN51_064560 [Arachis hypogaea]